MFVSNRHSNKNRKALIISLLFDFIALPLIILLILSLPRIYACLTFSDWSTQFPGSYENLNLTLAYLLAALYFLFKQIAYRSTKIVLSTIILLLLATRIVDIEMQRVFGYSFSPQFFAHIEPETFVVFLKQYWLPLAGFIIAVFLVFYYIVKIRCPDYQTRKVKLICACIFALMAIRSIVVLQKNAWHSSVDFASQLFIEQAFAYYQKTDILDRLTYTSEEIEVIEQLGFNLSKGLPDLKSGDLQKYNIIILYLEGFNADFTSVGGSPYLNLTPHLDSFARRNIYFPNFYNAVTPTINSLISGQCGLLPAFDNQSLDKFIYAPDVPCLSDYLDSLNYTQVLLQGSSTVFSGVGRFAEFHHFDEIIGRDVLAKRYPALKNKMTSWGLKDWELMRVARDIIKELSRREPFHISIFTLDTHPPFDTSRKCNIFKEKARKLNAIHCVDIVFGSFYTFLEEEKILDDTILLVTGDHRVHGGKPYGRVFTALHLPDDMKQRNRRITLNTYTPDIAPTILEVIGTDLVSLNVGKSMFSERRNYQRMIAPTFEIYNDRLYPKTKCPGKRLESTRIELLQRPFEDCAHRKINYFIDKWLLDLF